MCGAGSKDRRRSIPSPSIPRLLQWTRIRSSPRSASDACRKEGKNKMDRDGWPIFILYIFGLLFDPLDFGDEVEGGSGGEWTEGGWGR